MTDRPPAPDSVDARAAEIVRAYVAADARPAAIVAELRAAGLLAANPVTADPCPACAMPVGRIVTMPQYDLAGLQPYDAPRPTDGQTWAWMQPCRHRFTLGFDGDPGSAVWTYRHVDETTGVVSACVYHLAPDRRPDLPDLIFPNR